MSCSVARFRNRWHDSSHRPGCVFTPLLPAPWTTYWQLTSAGASQIRASFNRDVVPPQEDDGSIGAGAAGAGKGAGDWGDAGSIREFADVDGKASRHIKNREVSQMPGGDGTGPMGMGRGPSAGPGAGRGRGRMGGARLRQGGQVGLGAGGNCVCPACRKSVAHQRGMPCNQVKCPGCGAVMTRAR